MAFKTPMLVSTLLMISFLVAMQSMDMAFAGECENKCWSRCVDNHGKIDNRCYNRCILNNCRLPTLDLDSSGQPLSSDPKNQCKRECISSKCLNFSDAVMTWGCITSCVTDCGTERLGN